MGWMDFLLQKILGANQPTPPPGPLPESQMQHLGRHFGGQILNNPEEISYYVEQTTEPYGRLGKMLTEEERMSLLKLLMRTSNTR